MKNTERISMATLRALAAHGEITESQLETIRVNREDEQADIRFDESQFAPHRNRKLLSRPWISTANKDW